MKRSRSPSSTAWVALVSTPVTRLSRRSIRVTAGLLADHPQANDSAVELLGDLEVKCTNQNGQDTLQGHATVAAA